MPLWEARPPTFGPPAPVGTLDELLTATAYQLENAYRMLGLGLGDREYPDALDFYKLLGPLVATACDAGPAGIAASHDRRIYVTGAPCGGASVYLLLGHFHP